MNGTALRVAIVEPDSAADPLRLPFNREAAVVFRDDLTPDGVERLIAAKVDVIVLDLRHASIPQIRPAVRLLRLLVPALRVVAVVDVDDDTAEQAAATSGACVFRGWGQTPIGLLRAVLASRTVIRSSAHMHPAGLHHAPG
jgi:DNA-binding NarL/FixJ family response regulator